MNFLCFLWTPFVSVLSLHPESLNGLWFFFSINSVICLFSVLWFVCSVMWAHKSEMTNNKNFIGSLWCLHIIPWNSSDLYLFRQFSGGDVRSHGLCTLQICEFICGEFRSCFSSIQLWRVYIVCDVCVIVWCVDVWGYLFTFSSFAFNWLIWLVNWKVV